MNAVSDNYDNMVNNYLRRFNKIYIVAKKVVACYYSSWSIYREVEGKFTINDIDVSLCTHLIYSFAGLDINSRITSLDPQYDITNGNTITI